MRRFFRCIPVLLAAGFTLFLFTGCDSLVRDRIEIAGNWLYRNGDQSVLLTITSSRIAFYDVDEDNIQISKELYQELKIEDFDNDGFNGGDTEETDCGYMVVQYVDPPDIGDLSDEADKFGIIRWAGFDGTADLPVMSYSEGFLEDDAGGRTLCNSAADAIEQMTEEYDVFHSYPGGGWRHTEEYQ